jgi:uncharacterized protein YneF (UPF0154 family)
MEAVIAVFIPIVMFLVIGIIIVTFIYFRSKERQMLIDKGLSTEDIKLFFEQKRDPYVLLKIGIISIFFGLGLGLGMLSGNEEVWLPMSIFIFTGGGFVVANILGNKLRKQYQSN